MKIDLLAIDPRTYDKYHIESGVSIAGGFSKLTTLQYDKERLKVRSHMAQQRRTLGYFTERKFSEPTVIQTLEQYGFKPNGYHKSS